MNKITKAFFASAALAIAASRVPLALWIVEDLLHERGINVSHERIQFWWNRFALCLPQKSARKNGQPDTRIFKLVMAIEWGVREDQR